MGINRKIREKREKKTQKPQTWNDTHRLPNLKPRRLLSFAKERLGEVM